MCVDDEELLGNRLEAEDKLESAPGVCDPDNKEGGEPLGGEPSLFVCMTLANGGSSLVMILLMEGSTPMGGVDLAGAPGVWFVTVGDPMPAGGDRPTNLRLVGGLNVAPMPMMDAGFWMGLKWSSLACGLSHLTAGGVRPPGGVRPFIPALPLREVGDFKDVGEPNPLLPERSSSSSKS